MAKCPKCGYKLKIYNISQNCPKCKVNIRFYNFEENFYRNAKQVELSQAVFHVKARRLKASFFGSKMVVARLVLSLLPLLTLLIPAANFHYEMPYKSVDFSAGLLGIVNLVMGGDLGFLFGMGGSSLVGSEFSAVTNSLILFAAAAVFALLVVICTLLGFLSIRNMQKVICGFAAGGILVSIAAQIVAFMSVGSLNESIVMTGAGGFGLFVTAAGFAVVFVLNFLLHKSGIPVEYDEGMEERVQINEKVKAGELSIDDLPQPIVKTAETEAIEEEIRKEEESVAKALAEKQAKEAKKS